MATMRSAVACAWDARVTSFARATNSSSLRSARLRADCSLPAISATAMTSTTNRPTAARRRDIGIVDMTAAAREEQERYRLRARER